MVSANRENIAPHLDALIDAARAILDGDASLSLERGAGPPPVMNVTWLYVGALYALSGVAGCGAAASELPRRVALLFYILTVAFLPADDRRLRQHRQRRPAASSRRGRRDAVGFTKYQFSNFETRTSRAARAWMHQVREAWRHGRLRCERADRLRLHAPRQRQAQRSRRCGCWRCRAAEVRHHVRGR